MYIDILWYKKKKTNKQKKNNNKQTNKKRFNILWSKNNRIKFCNISNLFIFVISDREFIVNGTQ